MLTEVDVPTFEAHCEGLVDGGGEEFSYESFDSELE